ncbi:MAG: alpha/beta hydrolase [Gemmatimonadetes bacterium]|nr:alpha/beta hydrolase [Gemmatimonadota bacterium]
MVDIATLLLPGMTLNATIFPSTGLPSVEADFTGLRVSPNGDLPPGVPDGMALYAEKLDRLVESHPVWRSASRRILIGHSFGGMLGLSWLLRHGCRGLAAIDGMVLVATAAGPMLDSARLRLAKFGSLEWRVGVKRPMRVWNTPVVTRAVKRLMCRGGLDSRQVDFSRLRNPSDAALGRAGWRNTDWRAMRTFRIAMQGFDVRDRLAGIPISTIVLHGTEDSVLPVEVGKRLADALPHAELRIVAGAGHGLPVTHGGEVLAAVRTLRRRMEVG